MVVPQRGTRSVGVGEARVSPKKAVRARRSILKLSWKSTPGKELVAWDDVNVVRSEWLDVLLIPKETS